MLQDGVDKSDLPKAIKQSIHVPASFMDGLVMSHNFHALLALFFGKETQVAKAVSSWVGHMLNWEAVYEAQQNNDHTFMTQLLFPIDSMVKLHLDSCQQAKSMDEVNDEILYSAQVQQKVVTMEFTCKILECLHFKPEPLDIKNPQGGGAKGGWGGGGGHQDQDKDQTKVFNTNPKYRKWFIQENKSYSEMFHSRADKFPKDIIMSSA